MMYGYFSSGYSSSLFEDLDFAKDHFDYVELTLPCGLELNGDNWPINPSFLKEIKRVLGNFPAVGHVHWKVDLSENNPDEITKANKIIDAFVSLNIHEATVHPSKNKNGHMDATYKNDIAAITVLAEYAKERGIDLLSENVLSPPFNSFEAMQELLERSKTGMTLDMGHAIVSNANIHDLLTLNVKHILYWYQ